jgi:hypothetical protein
MLAPYGSVTRWPSRNHDGGVRWCNSQAPGLDLLQSSSNAIGYESQGRGNSDALGHAAQIDCCKTVPPAH